MTEQNSSNWSQRLCPSCGEQHLYINGFEIGKCIRKAAEEKGEIKSGYADMPATDIGNI